MLEISVEQKNLIERLIQSSSKYAGNEDLFEDFFNEVFRRSCHVLNGVNEVTFVENYLRKVVQSAILAVLKDMGRVRRLSKGFVSDQREIPVSSLNILQENSVSQLEFEENIYNNNFSYALNKTSLSIEDLLISKDLLKNIIDIVFKENALAPQKQYLEIFKLRFKDNKKQSEIAEELSISQSEVSKRLVEISKIVKNKLEN